MNTIYWLTRLAVLSKVSIIFLILLAISLPICIIAYLDWKGYKDEDNKDVRKYKRWLRNGFIVFFICLSGTLFIPDKKDMVLIYGVGPIYDYVQDNDKVKQLPDKCIDYLDALVEMEKEELLEQKNKD